ncbi:MAG: TolC family protein [Rubripirellula sp.]
MHRLVSVLSLLVATVTCLDGQEPQTPLLFDALQVSTEMIETHAEPMTPVHAVEPLTLAEVEEIAVRSNPTLAAAIAKTRAARGKQLQAGLYPNPVVGYHGVEIGLRDTPGQQGGFVSQKFITAGKRQLDRSIAGKEIDEAKYRFHAQKQRVLSDVSVRFYDALVAQRRVALTKELARIGQEAVAATEKLVDARQGTENDLRQAEIKSDEAQILIANARNESDEAWRRLVAVAGVPTMPIRPVLGNLDADLPSLDWDRCAAALLQGNPALNAARVRADRAKAVIARARREPIPNVDVSVSHRYHNVTEDHVTNVQVGIPVPVFDRNQGNIRTAEAEWIVACKEAKRVELDLQDRLAVAYRRYANARQQVDRYRQRMLPRAERSLQLVTDGYETGQVEYLTMLNSQTTYLQVNLSHLDSQRELRAAASVIEAQLLTDSLVSDP